MSCRGAESTWLNRRGSLSGDRSGCPARLVRDAAGEADGVPPGGRALWVLDMGDGERSDESRMQDLNLLEARPVLQQHFTES